MNILFCSVQYRYLFGIIVRNIFEMKGLGFMEFLRLLESIRTPFGDTFFSVVTHLGEETFFIIAGLLLFWQCCF